MFTINEMLMLPLSLVSFYRICFAGTEMIFDMQEVLMLQSNIRLYQQTLCSMN
jgi:hypothetical protein